MKLFCITSRQVHRAHVISGGVSAVCLCLLTGCETVSRQQHSQDQAQVKTQIMTLRSNVDRLNARVDGIVTEREKIYSQLQSLHQTLNENTQVMDGRISAIEANMGMLAEQQKSDKDDIVNSLSQRMANLVQEQSSSRTASISSEGYEHTVKSGQTLSEIAAAYGVTREIVVRANNLKNENMLRVGQVLFIPE